MTTSRVDRRLDATSATSAPEVLVVDDNETARYTKVRILRQSGYQVREAANGADALRAVQEHAPRLVLLDVQLPDVNGWEVCRRIKAAPETASVLVLQVSATYVSEGDTVRALDGGADACLTEPIEPPVLVATVRALLRARQAEDELREVLAREQTIRAAAEAANRTKDEFLATLSHELRSPLGAMLLWLTLLRSGRLDAAKQTRALEAIERNARLQAKLIEDLLDVSRIISGKLRIELSLIELAPIVEAAIENIRPAADAKEIAVETIVDADVGRISGDATRLQQVVWNLLSNAVKFTPKRGHVTVEVGRARSAAEIRVSDSGRGIDPAVLPHIFERFHQADSSSTRAESGLGLGLAIVRHIVEMHGGTVDASSAGIGKGATFVVTLPLPALQSRVEGTPLALAAPAPAGDSLGGARVLVLDDEADARDSIAVVLESNGAAVQVAASVPAALALARTTPPDVIVSDIAMPGQDGFAFMRCLRELPGASIPALALTAYADTESNARVIAAGYEECLAKPIEAETLVAAVERLVGAARRHGTRPN